MACPLCNSNNGLKARFPRSTFFNNKLFIYKKCDECDLVYIDPIPSKSDLYIMYSSNYHNLFYFKDKPFDYSYLDLYINFQINSNSILDIGCGDATFLNYFSSRGFICTGLEFDLSLVTRLGSNYPKIKFYCVDEFFCNNSHQLFSYIHLGDVLEHIDSPVEYLEQVIKYLNPNNGRLIVEGPLEQNANLSFLFRKIISSVTAFIFPKRISNHIPYHITFTDSVNQLKLFEKCGLKTIHFEIFETPWPYPDVPHGNIILMLKYCVARISIKISKMIPSAAFGNRFLYVGQLP